MPRIVLLPGLDGTGALFDGFVRAAPARKIARCPRRVCVRSSRRRRYPWRSLGFPVRICCSKRRPKQRGARSRDSYASRASHLTMVLRDGTPALLFDPFVVAPDP
jgi:hypothetical protein